MTTPLLPGIHIDTVTITGPVNLFDPNAITAPILAAITDLAASQAANAADQGAHMSELDDRLADLKATEDTNTAKLATLIADFEAAGTLTDAQKTALDALKAEVVGNSDAIDAADPNAVTPPAV